jgi:peptidoglycan/xylan/chitin deacetylase (PgdA/CDA1 family)
MKRAYLTIDDSPTRHTDALTGWLAARNIPAVLFVIGSGYQDLHLTCEGIEQNPDPVRRAIEKGFVIGNHTLTHRRASECSANDLMEDIKKTDYLIDTLYKEAGKPRTHKLFRFPHLDRGAGGWVVDYAAAGKHENTLKDLFGLGLNITLDPPTQEQADKKNTLQAFLKSEGFSTACFQDITFAWYTDTEMADAADSLYTFSTSDWMINPDFAPHSAGWAYQSLEELKTKIDEDKWLHAEDSANIILAHDHNNLFGGTTALIAHMVESGIQFIEIR